MKESAYFADVFEWMKKMDEKNIYIYIYIYIYVYFFFAEEDI